MYNVFILCFSATNDCDRIEPIQSLFWLKDQSKQKEMAIGHCIHSVLYNMIVYVYILTKPLIYQPNSNNVKNVLILTSNKVIEYA